MSKTTAKTVEVQAVPFFARFLEQQDAQPESEGRFTLKYPSDWEDV
jgi:Serine endopeptidase inhibitors